VQLGTATKQLGHEEGLSLLELVVAMALAALVLFAATSWLISTNRAEAISTARSVNNAAAQSVVDQLDTNIRFATWVAISGSTLYVTNGSVANPPITCTEWTSSGGNLTEQTSSSHTSVIARGVSNLSFSGASVFYDGLVSVTFTINQTAGSLDANGVSINETLSAGNMASPVTALGACTFS
jgi:type II secretory pathway pseudopilin PulG